MQVASISIIILFITALSNTIYAGESTTNGTGETESEPECDYFSLPEPL
jgi:hypothetical protein